METQKLPNQIGDGKFEHPCILDILCNKFSAIKDEVKTIREHTWKPHIKKFFVQKVRLIFHNNSSKLRTKLSYIGLNSQTHII